MLRVAILSLLASAIAGTSLWAQTREQKVLNDRKKFEGNEQWIYNDLARGFAEARKTGKPLLVVLRCLPCEECVKLDDDVVNDDPRIKPLLAKYVCVRAVSTNGLDLALFQYDYDQSFAVFLFNGDGTIYGRFGTRSHRTSWAGDVSVEGLARALEGGLELHAGYPGNQQMLASRRGPAPEFARPELIPGLKGKYGSTITYEAKVVQSCIHCHQIGDAQRELIRDRKQPFPDEVLFPYPHPRILGLILDPTERATVKEVENGSPAEIAGFRSGDRIVTLQRQPLLSIADVQWVLHHTSPAGASLRAEVNRGDRAETLTLTLPKGWRTRDDISWRSSTWNLRRMVLGGLLLVGASDEVRTRAGLGKSDMALRVEHVGQYGPHAAAQKAGFRKDDLVISFDGRTDLLRETDVIAHGLQARRTGEQVGVTVLRGNQKLSLTIPMQP